MIHQEVQPNKRELRLAWLRLILGGVQMAGAVASLVPLCETGPSRETGATAASAGCATLPSRLLFPRGEKQS